MIAEKIICVLVIDVDCHLLLLTQNYKAALCGIVKLANINNILANVCYMLTPVRRLSVCRR